MYFSTLRKFFLLSAISFFAVAAGAAESPAPVWEWKPSSAAEQTITEKNFVTVPDARKLYNPAKPFSIEIHIKPEAAQDRLGGIVSDYGGSDGGWYFSFGSAGDPLAAHLVLIDADGKYTSAKASKTFTPDKWQTVLLINDGKYFRALLDGKIILEASTEIPIGIAKKSTFLVGKRRKDFFHGEIDSVRLWNTALPLPKGAIMTEANYILNSSFEDGETLEDVLLWHRMTETDASIPSGWEIDSNQAYEGKRSLRTNAGAPLTLMAESWAQQRNKEPWVFSVWMKADRDGVACKLSVGAYWRLDERVISRDVTLSTEWKQYELVMPQFPVESHAKEQGPINFTISPAAKSTVWVDAAQWQKGEKASEWSAAESDFGDAVVPRYPAANAVTRSGKGASSWTGKIPLRVFKSQKNAGAVMPISVGVPFRQKLWNGRGAVRLTDAQGKEIPIQTEILAQQNADSVRVLGVQFVDQIKSNVQDYQLEITDKSTFTEASKPFQWQLNAPKKAGNLWETITDASGNAIVKSGSLVAIGLDGKKYFSTLDKNADWKIENDGNLYKSYRASGRLMSEDGSAILGYVARVHLWRDIPGVKVEISVINTRNEGSVPVRTIYWQAENAEQTDSDERIEKRVVYHPQENKFEATEITSARTKPIDPKSPQFIIAPTGQRNIALHAPNAWEYHPSAIALNHDNWQGYLWADGGVRSVLLPRNLALTREFWLRETDGVSAITAWENPPLAIADSKWWQENEVILPFAANDSKEHPFMDDILSPDRLLSRVNDEKIESEKGWGIFDYGDFHGDGGWGNLESYRDWAMFLTGLRAENYDALTSAFRSARHYREIDIDQNDGLPYVHNFVHVAGSKDTSHAWPSGVALDYLLTGSKRSKEVMMLHGETILATNEDALAQTGLRTLGRWLLNLADVYLITGDERYKKKYFSQIEASRRFLAEDKNNPDRSIFSHIGSSASRRLVPFHAWYGITALQRMQDLTGDESLSDFVSGEVAATINPELYREDIEQLWPEASFEDGMPLMLADYARHRGSFAYPVLIDEAKKSDNADLRQLAIDALYAWAIEGRMTDRIESTLASTPVREVRSNEQELIEAAADRMWNGASAKILNGDFELSKNSWRYWRPFPSKSISYHTNWEQRRKSMVSLDTEIKKEGQQSLRVDLKDKRFYSPISIDTNRFRLPQGHNKITGWIRWDENVKAPEISWQLRDLKGNYGKVDGISGTPGLASGAIKDSFGNIQGKISEPDKDSWRHFEISLDAKQRSVGNFLIKAELKDGAESGHMWLDSVQLESASHAH